MVYLWVNEKNHFLQTNLHKTPSEKNVPNCSSVNKNIGDLMRVITKKMKCANSAQKYNFAPSLRSRVILNGQFGCGGGGAGVGRGAVDAWWRRGGHKGHDSLKFEKDGSLAKCASGATKIDR